MPAEIAKKKQAEAERQPKAELLLFENYLLSSSTLSFKNNRRYYKKCIKNISLNEDMKMTMNMRLKMKKINYIDTTQIDLDLDMDTNILCKKCVSV